MKTFSQKSVLLVATAATLCAFAMPSMASAASWGPIGTEHTLDGNNAVGFFSDINGIQADCSRTQLTTEVVSAAVVEITTASFTGCTLNGPAGLIGLCTLTALPTGLPWTATAVTTTNIQIHGVDIDMFLENHPGSTACAATGLLIRITGTISSARWTGNGANQHEILLNGAQGLVTHSALGNGQPVTVTGTLRDTQQTLTVS